MEHGPVKIVYIYPQKMVIFYGFFWAPKKPPPMDHLLDPGRLDDLPRSSSGRLGASISELREVEIRGGHREKGDING